MSTYLERLPDEIYEKIFSKLNRVQDKISLLEVHPKIRPKKFFLSCLKCELPEIYQKLKTSKINKVLLDQIISQLLTPEVLNMMFNNIRELLRDNFDFLETDYNKAQIIFWENSNSILTENSDHVPSSFKFLRNFLMIVYRDRLFVNCMKGEYGTKAKNTLENYFKNYATNKYRIDHFSEAMEHERIYCNLRRYRYCDCRDDIIPNREMFEYDNDNEKFLKFSDDEHYMLRSKVELSFQSNFEDYLFDYVFSPDYNTERGNYLGRVALHKTKVQKRMRFLTDINTLRSFLVEKQTITLTRSIVKEHDHGGNCFKKQILRRQEHVQKIIKVIAEHPKVSEVSHYFPTDFLELFCDYRNYLKNWKTKQNFQENQVKTELMTTMDSLVRIFGIHENLAVILKVELQLNKIELLLKITKADLTDNNQIEEFNKLLDNLEKDETEFLKNHGKWNYGVDDGDFFKELLIRYTKHVKHNKENDDCSWPKYYDDESEASYDSDYDYATDPWNSFSIW